MPPDISLPDVTSPSFPTDKVDAHLQKTLESFGYGYFTCDAEWRFTYVSARAEIFIGISQDDLERSCWEVSPFMHDTLLEHEFNRAALGEIRDFDYFFESRSLWLQFRCFPRKDGGVAVYFKDITDHKQIIDSHLKAKNLLKLSLQSGGAGAWEWNFQDGVRWSDELYRIFGMVPGRDAITIDLWKQSVHPDDQPELIRQLEAATAQQGRIGFEYRIVLSSGIRWIYDVGDMYCDASGVPLGRAGICYDITERKLMEEEIRSLNATLERRVEERTAQLRASEEQFRVMFEKSDVGMAQADPASGRFLKANDALCRFLGCSREELLHKTVADVTHPDDREASAVQFAALAAGDSAGFHEVKRYLRPEGTVVLAEVTANLVCDERGTPLRIMAVMLDITERTRTEQQLLESLNQKEILATIIRLTSQPFAVGFPDGKVCIVNPAFERLVGYTVEELMSMDWVTALTPPEWFERERRCLVELQHTGTSVTYEKEYVRKDGSRVPVELLVHLKNDASGAPEFYYAFVTDITERKLNDQFSTLMVKNTRAPNAMPKGKTTVRMR